MQESSQVIEGVYQSSQIMLKKVEPPITFFSRALKFGKNYVLPTVLAFGAGYAIGKK